MYHRLHLPFAGGKTAERDCLFGAVPFFAKRAVASQIVLLCVSSFSEVYMGNMKIMILANITGSP